MTVTGKVYLWLRHHHIENLKSALLTMPQFAIKFHTNSLLFVAWPRPSQSRRPVSWLYPCKITSSSVLARREGPAPRGIGHTGRLLGWLRLTAAFFW